MIRQLSKKAVLFIFTVTLTGLAALSVGIKNTSELSIRDVATLLLLISLVVLTDIYRVELFTGSMRLSMSTVATFGAVLLFPLQCSMVAIGAFLTDILLRKPIIKALFNSGQWALASFASGYVWYELREFPKTYNANSFLETRNLLAVLLSATIYLVINSLLVSVVISLTTNTPPVVVIRKGLSGIIVQFLIQPALGLLIAILYVLNPISMALVISPLAAVYYSLRNFDHLRKQTLKTIERLSDILDRRDPQTDQHSIRVAHYVRLICEELGLSSELTESIVSAARVHDLGKIGIPDAVLLKPGKLTDEEWELIRKHPEYGEDILSPLSAYEECLPAIRHHHERWDGMGYPDGLAGEDIPLGARIIAVADTYDAMVSSRPYRKGADKPDALLEIRRQAGKQFDPKVVEAFLKVMENRAEVAMPISINVAFDKQANT